MASAIAVILRKVLRRVTRFLSITASSRTKIAAPAGNIRPPRDAACRHERDKGIAAMNVDALTLSGLVGVCFIVAAYFANQKRWLNSDDWRFPAANLVGSVLILMSLFVQWNTPSAVIEVIWAAISVYGLVNRA
jgi:hypothetical protein